MRIGGETAQSHVVAAIVPSKGAVQIQIADDPDAETNTWSAYTVEIGDLVGGPAWCSFSHSKATRSTCSLRGRTAAW